MFLRPSILRSYFLPFFLILGFVLSVNNAVAEDYVTTTDLVKEIEKTLLFDKSSRQQLDFYKQKEVIKKKENNLAIKHDDRESDRSAEIDIVVVDSNKTVNADARIKEKMAYNAALVGQYEASVELYKQVIALEPDNLYAKFSLAVVYQKLGQNRQAKTSYYGLLKSDVDNKEEIVGNLLTILVAESPKDAFYLLSRLVIENPQSSYILSQAALAYDKIKSYDRATELLERAVANDPTCVEYKYNLAVLYDKRSDYANAIDAYSEVVRLSNGVEQNIPLDQIKNRIEFIRGKLYPSEV